MKRSLTCEICNEASSKYTCPKCKIRTCNVECCKSHKLKFNCDGKYDFVKLESRFDLDILKLKSDFSFLESIDRKIDDFEKILTPVRKLEARNTFLSKACKSKGINVIFMPHDLSRHKVNKSIYLAKDHKFYWTVEIMYENHSHILTNIDDSKTFGYIWGHDIKCAINESKIEPFYELIQSKLPLKFFILNRYKFSQSMSNVENLKNCAGKYVDKESVQIFSTEKLHNVLCGLTIIEFPTIVISKI